MFATPWAVAVLNVFVATVFAALVAATFVVVVLLDTGVTFSLAGAGL